MCQTTPKLNHDWFRSVYGEITELVPHDAQEPIGKHVTLTPYVDANLMDDVVTGRLFTKPTKLLLFGSLRSTLLLRQQRMDLSL
jgi:hypothetical protein